MTQWLGPRDTIAAFVTPNQSTASVGRILELSILRQENAVFWPTASFVRRKQGWSRGQAGSCTGRRPVRGAKKSLE